jgi:hypothetical protein
VKFATVTIAINPIEIRRRAADWVWCRYGVEIISPSRSTHSITGVDRHRAKLRQQRSDRAWSSSWMGQQPVVPTGDPLPESIQMIEGMSRVVGYPDGPLLWIIAGAGLLRHRARDAGTELTSRASASPLRY